MTRHDKARLRAMHKQCGQRHGEVVTIQCTLPVGHKGEHRWHRGPTWQSPSRPGPCPYFNAFGEPCVLPCDHWTAHRTQGGWQFAASSAHLKGQRPRITAMVATFTNLVTSWVMHGWRI